MQKFMASLSSIFVSIHVNNGRLVLEKKLCTRICTLQKLDCILDVYGTPPSSLS
jgi:hypothetical protein